MSLIHPREVILEKLSNFLWVGRWCLLSKLLGFYFVVHCRCSAVLILVFSRKRKKYFNLSHLKSHYNEQPNFGKDLRFVFWIFFRITRLRIHKKYFNLSLLKSSSAKSWKSPTKTKFKKVRISILLGGVLVFVILGRNSRTVLPLSLKLFPKMKQFQGGTNFWGRAEMKISAEVLLSWMMLKYCKRLES